MRAQKLSISLSKQQVDFVERYQSEHRYKTRSEVIKKALYILQQTQLEAAYHQANKELSDDFDITTSDGIEDDETW